MEKSNVRKNVNDLEVGDVIQIQAPYEENTPDYFNGHDPQEVRGYLVRDDYGNPYKDRPVVFMGYTGSELLYLPLTSVPSEGWVYRNIMQYKLEDNSMTPQNPAYKIDTYVEMSNLRAIPAKDEYSYEFYGEIDPIELDTILSEVERLTTHSTNKLRDRRAFIRIENVDTYQEKLLEMGFKYHPETETQCERFSYGNTVIYFQTDEIIHMHHERTLEEVRQIFRYDKVPAHKHTLQEGLEALERTIKEL